MDKWLHSLNILIFKYVSDRYLTTSFQKAGWHIEFMLSISEICDVLGSVSIIWNNKEIKLSIVNIYHTFS